MGFDDLLRLLVAALEEMNIPYAIGGSVASIAYGEPRATLDIDVVTSMEPSIVDAFCGRFSPDDFYVDADAAPQAV